MSDITGTWDATVSTPMGAQQFTLDLTVDGDAVQGTATRENDTMPLHDGHLHEGTAVFHVPMEHPMKLTLEFTVTVDGDALTGRAKAGFLPSFDVTATRRR